MWAVTPLLPPNYNAIQYNPRKQHSLAVWQLRHWGTLCGVSSSDTVVTVQCTEQWWCGGSYDRAHWLFWWALTIVLATPLPTYSAFAFAHLLQTCFSCNCNTTQCGTRALQYIRQTDILVVFCIQAFRKAAGFDFEIRFSFCWLQLSFNQFLKGWPELVLEFDI